MSKKERKDPPPLTRVTSQRPCRDGKIRSSDQEFDMPRRRKKPPQKFLTPEMLIAAMGLAAAIIGCLSQHIH